MKTAGIIVKRIVSVMNIRQSLFVYKFFENVGRTKTDVKYTFGGAYKNTPYKVAQRDLLLM